MTTHVERQVVSILVLHRARNLSGATPAETQKKSVWRPATVEPG